MSAIKGFFSHLSDGACWITGRLLKDFAELLESDRARLMGGCGDEVATSSGRFFRLNSGGGSASESGPVIVRKIGDNWKVGVVYDYFLQQPIVAGSFPVELTVTGKLTSVAPGDADSGWFPTEENDKVWIEGTVTSYVADSAYVQNQSSGGAKGGGAVENNAASPAEQSKFRIFLGEVVGDGAGGLRFKACAGKYHRLGLIFADSKDSGGGTAVAITGLSGEAM